jgi:hypothetical protein
MSLINTKVKQSARILLLLAAGFVGISFAVLTYNWHRSGAAALAEDHNVIFHLTLGDTGIINGPKTMKAHVGDNVTIYISGHPREEKLVSVADSSVRSELEEDGTSMPIRFIPDAAGSFDIREETDGIRLGTFVVTN